MRHLMYKEIDYGELGRIREEKSTKLCPSRLEQVALPSVFHTKDYNTFRDR